MKSAPGDLTSMLIAIRTEGIAARGRAEMVKFVSGRKLTPMQAIRAKCYDCMGYYADGKRDCGALDCPLHRFMPYNPGADPDPNASVDAPADADDPDDQSALEDAGSSELT